MLSIALTVIMHPLFSGMCWFSCLQRLLGLLLSGQESAVLVANSLALFARLLLQHPAAFEQLLGSAAAATTSTGQQQQGSSSPEALLLALVSVWCEAFDSIAQPLARKLAACGLAAVIGLPVKVSAAAGLPWPPSSVTHSPHNHSSTQVSCLVSPWWFHDTRRHRQERCHHL